MADWTVQKRGVRLLLLFYLTYRLTCEYTVMFGRPSSFYNYEKEICQHF